MGEGSKRSHGHWRLAWSFFGGWANTLSVAAGGEHFEPSLVVRFLSGGEFKSLDYHKFNTEHVGWQFGCWAISAPVDYDQILIAFAYERNAQTGMFTNLFLHREAVWHELCV